MQRVRRAARISRWSGTTRTAPWTPVLAPTASSPPISPPVAQTTDTTWSFNPTARSSWAAMARRPAAETTFSRSPASMPTGAWTPASAAEPATPWPTPMAPVAAMSGLALRCRPTARSCRPAFRMRPEISLSCAGTAAGCWTARSAASATSLPTLAARVSRPTATTSRSSLTASCWSAGTTKTSDRSSLPCATTRMGVSTPVLARAGSSPQASTG